MVTSAEPRSRIGTLQKRASDLISASAVLCVGGAVADGSSNRLELETYVRAFSGYYLLSPRLAAKITKRALRQMLQGKDLMPIEHACEVVNEYLTATQKQSLFEIIAAITNADGRLDPRERLYLEIVSSRLQLGTIN